MVVCWAVKGGVGTTVVVAALATALAQRRGLEVLLVDLAGDLPCTFGVAEPEGPALAEWLGRGDDVPPDALRRLEISLAPGLQLLPRGSGPLVPERAPVLAALLAADTRAVVIDAGAIVAPSCPAVDALLGVADRSLLITRACPLAQRRLRRLPHRPSGIVVVRDHRRAMSWAQATDGVDAPVLAELDVDPSIGAAVDAGLARRRLPRSVLHALADIA